jgi:hypothetical protein
MPAPIRNADESSGLKVEPVGKFVRGSQPAMKMEVTKSKEPTQGTQKEQRPELPEWQPGETRPVMMPYNLEVLATYKGPLTCEEMLPSSGNQLGDRWVLGDTPLGLDLGARRS